MELGRWFSVSLVALTALFSAVNLHLTHQTVSTDPPTLLHQQSLATSTPKDRLLSDNVEPQPRPPLSTIVNGYNITGDPSWLLNFAVIGFPKCGTSTLMHHLESHPEVSMFKDERCENSFNQHAVLMKDLYEKFPASNSTHQVIRGIKCPADIENTKLSMRNYRKYFYKTDFVVGIRHPVLWFESFYNFRVHNEFKMPNATKLIGQCLRGYWNVCTFRSNFHIFLSNLGKTQSTKNEWKHLIDKRFHRRLDPVPTNRRVFLYEVSQLSSFGNPHLSETFRVDLQQFLHLQSPIAPFIWFKPGRNHSSSAVHQRVTAKKMDICHSVYDPLRHVLLHQARQASEWIRTYFMEAPGVVVSNPEHFRELLQAWMVDPCVERNSKRGASLKKI